MRPPLFLCVRRWFEMCAAVAFVIRSNGCHSVLITLHTHTHSFPTFLLFSSTTSIHFHFVLRAGFLLTSFSPFTFEAVSASTGARKMLFACKASSCTCFGAGFFLLLCFPSKCTYLRLKTSFFSVNVIFFIFIVIFLLLKGVWSGRVKCMAWSTVVEMTTPLKQQQIQRSATKCNESDSGNVTAKRKNRWNSSQRFDIAASHETPCMRFSDWEINIRVARTEIWEVWPNHTGIFSCILFSPAWFLLIAKTKPKKHNEPQWGERQSEEKRSRTWRFVKNVSISAITARCWCSLFHFSAFDK